MFESLSQKLNTIFNKISSKGRISERDIEETLKEIRLAKRAACYEDIYYSKYKGNTKDIIQIKYKWNTKNCSMFIENTKGM